MDTEDNLREDTEADTTTLDNMNGADTEVNEVEGDNTQSAVPTRPLAFLDTALQSTRLENEQKRKMARISSTTAALPDWMTHPTLLVHEQLPIEVCCHTLTQASTYTRTHTHTLSLSLSLPLSHSTFLYFLF